MTPMQGRPRNPSWRVLRIAHDLIYDRAALEMLLNRYGVPKRPVRGGNVQALPALGIACRAMPLTLCLRGPREARGGLPLLLQSLCQGPTRRQAVRTGAFRAIPQDVVRMGGKWWRRCADWRVAPVMCDNSPV